MTHLVTGATGFLGSHFVQALVARQQSVRALVRAPQKAAELENRGVDVRVADIRDPEGVAAAVRDVRVVFHCAAAGGIHPSKQAIQSTNLIGLRNVLDAIRQTDSARLVFVSGLSVLGMRNLASATEDLPWKKSGDVEADVKVRGEQLILDYHAQHNVDAVILRPSIVYGPGNNNLSQVLRAIRDGSFAYIGSRANIVPLIHIDDFVEVAFLAAHSAQAKGRIYHITDGTQTTIGEIVDCLADWSGLARPRLVLPYAIPYIGCLVFEMLQRLHLRAKQTPVNRATLRFLGTSRSVSICKAQEELGFAPKVFPREGIATMFQQLEKKT
jgi:dihydroflavonol-4-reductase